MSQHDMNLANASGAAFRSDANNALVALVSNSSGASEPTTTFAYQWWADTSSGLLKQRNAANNGWEVRGTLTETIVASRSTNAVLALADHQKVIVATASFTQTLTAAATLGDGWTIGYRVASGAVITFDPSATETIDGATTKVIAGPAAGFIVCDGSAFHTLGFDGGKRPTSQVFTSGSGTYTPPSGATGFRVRMVGGGGGSGGCATTAAGNFAASGGGAGGTYSEKWISAATMGASQSYAVGAGGSAGTAGNNAGGTGGTSSLGVLVTAPGGSGGSGSAASGTPGWTASATGGNPGVAGTGDISMPGQAGFQGMGSGTSTNGKGGAGGSSLLGFGGGDLSTITSAVGNAGQNYGGGAGGSAQGASQGVAIAGAAGAGGVIIIEEFYD